MHFLLDLINTSVIVAPLPLAQATDTGKSAVQIMLDIVNNSVYGFQAIDALWGTYCVIMIYWRMKQKGFKKTPA